MSPMVKKRKRWSPLPMLSITLRVTLLLAAANAHPHRNVDHLLHEDVWDKNGELDHNKLVQNGYQELAKFAFNGFPAHDPDVAHKTGLKFERQLNEDIGGFTVEKNFKAYVDPLDGVGFDADAKVSAPGGLLHGEAGIRGQLSPLSINGAFNKIVHIGPIGVETEAEFELSVVRLALKSSITPRVGVRDYNVEVGGVNLLAILLGDGAQGKLGIDVGYNRKERTFGAVIDLPEGSFGAHIGCRTQICLFTCFNVKLCQKRRRRRSSQHKPENIKITLHKKLVHRKSMLEDSKREKQEMYRDQISIIIDDIQITIKLKMKDFSD